MQEWCDTHLALNEHCVNADIDIYVKNALATDKKLLRLPAESRDEIERVFHEKSGGMFRWAALQLDEIRSLKMLKPRLISQVLHRLPRTLDETYERILHNIDDLYFEEARTALQWLTFSKEPLNIAQLAEACNVQIEDNGEVFVDEAPYDSISGLLGILSSLVLVERDDLYLETTSKEDLGTISGASQRDSDKNEFASMLKLRVRLAHFSVEEYLTSDRLRSSTASNFALVESESHGWLAQQSCAYIMRFAQLHDADWIRDTHWLEITDLHPLIEYAAVYWYDHQRLAEDLDGIQLRGLNLQLKLLGDKATMAAWLVLRWEIYGGEGSEGVLYWASRLGLHRTLNILLHTNPHLDVDVQGGDFGTALQAAAYFGHDKILRKLIQSGANVDLVAGRYATALQAAATKNNKSVVRILLQAGADINVQGGEYGTALNAAVENCDEDIAERLIQLWADVNAQGGLDGTALQVAARRGYESIVDMLLRAGADVNIQGGDYGTALQAAAYFGHESNVSMLLTAGADANIQGGLERNAFQAAAAEGRKDIAELLLLSGFDLHRNPDNNFALFAAVRGGCQEILEMVLATGVDIHDKGDLALHIAVKIQKPVIVNLLLARGADVNGQGPTEFGEPRPSILYVAARQRAVEILQAVLNNGADMNSLSPSEAYDLLKACWDPISVPFGVELQTKKEAIMLDALLDSHGPGADMWEEILSIYRTEGIHRSSRDYIYWDLEKSLPEARERYNTRRNAENSAIIHELCSTKPR